MSSRSTSFSSRRSSSTSRSKDSDDSEIESENELEIVPINFLMAKSRLIKIPKNSLKAHRPIRKEGIYPLIFQYFFDPKSVAKDLIDLYKNGDFEEAVSVLIQFFVDITGYQHIDVDEHQPISVHKIISELTTEPNQPSPASVWITGRYLVKETSRNANDIKERIFNFFEQFIFIAHCDGIVTRKCGLFQIFFDMLILMMKSDLNTIYHTGHTLGMHVVTIFVYIMNDSQCEEERRKCKQIINELYAIIKKDNVDSDLQHFKIKCLKEMYSWTALLPGVFVNENHIFKLFDKYLINKFAAVRIKTLEIIGKLLCNSEVLLVLRTRHLNKVVETIVGRFHDKSIEASVKAIATFMQLSAVNENEVFCTKTCLWKLRSLMFNQYFLIGAAACKFMYSFYQQAGYTPSEIIITFSEMSMGEGDRRQEVLVEGCLPDVPEIKDWNIYLHILLGNEVGDDVLRAVAKVFSAAVHHVLKGRRSDSNRVQEQLIPKYEIDMKDHEDVFNLFPQLCRVIQKRIKDEFVLTEIFKIFYLVKFDAEEITEENIKTICKNCYAVFNVHKYHKLIEEILNTLVCLKNVLDSNEVVNETIQKIVEKCGTNFVQFLMEKHEDSDIVEKQSVVYSYYDLNEKINLKYLLSRMADFTDKTLLFMMTCCKWCLIWRLRNVFKMKRNLHLKDDEFMKKETIGYGREFAETIIHMLKVCQNLELFQFLCNFYLAWNKEVKHFIKFDKSYQQLLLIVEDYNQKDFMNYFQDIVIKNEKDPLRERRDAVTNYLDLIIEKILQFMHLGTVFQYYHEYYNEYGCVMDSLLNNQSNYPDSKGVYVIIMSTITEMYDSILKKHNVVDPNSKEAQRIKLVIKQFLKHPFLSNAKDDFYAELLLMLVNYGTRSPSNYNILFFAALFIPHIKKKDNKNYLLAFLKKKVVHTKSDDAILTFANTIKGTANSTAKNKKQTPKKSSKEQADQSSISKENGASPHKKVKGSGRKKATATSTPKKATPRKFSSSELSEIVPMDYSE